MPWSPNTQKYTRECIESGTLSPDGFLHMKCLDGRYARITAIDLVSDRLDLRIKGSDEILNFATVEDLLEAGWAVD